MDKKTIRQNIRDRKRQFTQQQLDELSLAVISKLLEHPRIQEATTLLLYYSLPDEVNTHDLVNLLTQQGKKILLPKVIDGENMEIRDYTGPQDLQMGSYNILEPTGQLITDYGAIEVAVVPGMSFDTHCNRLGRGKGYYDRFLVKIPQAYKIGVCFDFQKLESIPTGEYDLPMNEVIS